MDLEFEIGDKVILVDHEVELYNQETEEYEAIPYGTVVEIVDTDEDDDEYPYAISREGYNLSWIEDYALAAMVLENE